MRCASDCGVLAVTMEIVTSVLYLLAITVRVVTVIATMKDHPVVPGIPRGGMRMPCGGRERALSGCEAIGVSTVPLGQKAAENCHRDADKQFKAPEKLETPGSDFVRRPYMLMNLGQRDEPPHQHQCHSSFLRTDQRIDIDVPYCLSVLLRTILVAPERVQCGVRRIGG